MTASWGAVAFRAMRRAVGVVRVSRTRGRAGDSFVSPTEQADRIRAQCERDGLTLLRIHEELDVSGGKPLDERPGLGPAVAAIEDHEADVIVGAYFDRLFRSLTAQAEALDRVEKAGGRVLAVDVGDVSTESAGKWLSASMLGIVAEYHRRTTAERVREALVAALARGVAPYGRVPAGYARREDGVYVPDERHAPAVRAAFEQRATGATVEDVWRDLNAAGVEITYGGAYALLHSRVYLGEIHFGKFKPNLAAHEPLVDRATWEAVQRARSPSGRKPQSERLLARLGVLLCESCGSRMGPSTATGATSRGGGGGRTYPIYRCGNKACPRPVSIMATLAEEAVISVVREALAGMRGRASREQDARDADAALERAQADLDAAIRAFTGVQDEPVALDRLTELRDARDRAREHAEGLRGLTTALTVSASSDWDLLSLDGRRAIIRAVVARAVVKPGRGPGRVRVKLVGE